MNKIPSVNHCLSSKLKLFHLFIQTITVTDSVLYSINICTIIAKDFTTYYYVAHNILNIQLQLAPHRIFKYLRIACKRQKFFLYPLLKEVYTSRKLRLN